MEHEIRDQTRVGVASIRGYKYQVLQTLNTWLDITPKEYLISEGNEDLDRITRAPDSEQIEMQIEEQVKYRSTSILQTSNEVLETACRYLVAFVYHRERKHQFKGILRTNAEIRLHKNTEFGKWLSGQQALPHDVLDTIVRYATAGGRKRNARVAGNGSETRRVGAANQRVGKVRNRSDNDEATAPSTATEAQVVAARTYIVNHSLEKEFLASVVWADRSGNFDELMHHVQEKIALRASKVPREGAYNALFMSALDRSTHDDPAERVLRTIDADMLLAKTTLDAIIRDSKARPTVDYVVVWTEQGPPSVAVAIALFDPLGLQSRIDDASRRTKLQGLHLGLRDVLRGLLPREEFVAYVSLRRKVGPRGVHVCFDDVVRHVRYRHSPTHLVSAAPIGQKELALLRRIGWPAPTNGKETAEPVFHLAELIGHAVTARNRKLLDEIGSRLRWVHLIDDGAYFTAERPLEITEERPLVSTNPPRDPDQSV